MVTSKAEGKKKDVKLKDEKGKPGIQKSLERNQSVGGKDEKASDQGEVKNAGQGQEGQGQDPPVASDPAVDLPPSDVKEKGKEGKKEKEAKGGKEKEGKKKKTTFGDEEEEEEEEENELYMDIFDIPGIPGIGHDHRPTLPTTKKKKELEEEQIFIPDAPRVKDEQTVMEAFATLTQTNVQELQNQLAKVKLVWPENLPSFDKEYFDDIKFQKYPKSYISCSAKEKAVLWHAENFRLQFQNAFPKRRPLFIAPKNECGFQKLFPTFISPSMLGYCDFFDPERAAAFLADFFAPQILSPSSILPPQIKSHKSVIEDDERKANAYEMSIVLASILIGTGFKAYVVDGYADKNVVTKTYLKEFKDDGKIKITKVVEERRGYESPAESDTEDLPVPYDLYNMRKKPEVKSQFLIEKIRKEKVEEEEREREREQREQEEAAAKAAQKVEDAMLGYRTHSWVLVVPEARGVTEPFFLEPFSGKKKSVEDPSFLGIEAVFNHKNYYVNLQDCSTGIAKINWDFEESLMWSKLLHEPPPRKKKFTPVDAVAVTTFEEDEDVEESPYERYLDMPVTWTPAIFITQKDYEMKYPKGKKTFRFTDADVDDSVDYVEADGRVRRVIKYFQSEKGETRRIQYIEEEFRHRLDHLTKRKFVQQGRILYEYFEKGRKDALKEHMHVGGDNNPESQRKIYYYADSHPQNVSFRQIIKRGLIEHFEGRDDKLYYRFIGYGGILCSTKPNEDEKTSKVNQMIELLKDDESSGRSIKRPRRIITKIVEKYHRSPELPYSEDIAEKFYLLEKGAIRLIFHRGDENYTRGFLEYYKNEADEFNRRDFNPKDCEDYTTDPFVCERSRPDRAQFLKRANKDIVDATGKARRSEDQIYATVKSRVQEDWKHQIKPDPFAGDLTETYLKKKEEEAKEFDDDLGEIDFVTPWIEKYGIPKNLQEEILMKKRIIARARQHILARAELLRNKHKLESTTLKTKNKRFEMMKEMTSAEEELFNTAYNEALFRLQVMERRLVRHRQRSVQGFYKLLLAIFEHPILNRFSNFELARPDKKISVSLKDLKNRLPDVCPCPTFVYRFTKKRQNELEELKAATMEEEEEEEEEEYQGEFTQEEGEEEEEEQDEKLSPHGKTNEEAKTHAKIRKIIVQEK